MSIQPRHETTWVPGWSFSDRIRRIRRELRLAQDEFALDLGVNINQYKAWESGRNTPRDIVSIAKRMELMTMVPATWILGLDEVSGGHNPRGPGESKKADEVSNTRTSDYKDAGSPQGNNVVFLWPSRSTEPMFDDWEIAVAS